MLNGRAANALIPRSLPIYPYQQTQVIEIYSQTFNLTTSGIGVIASVLTLNMAAIPTGSTRWPSVFDEVRFLKAKIVMVPVGVSAGTTFFWVDENDAATPTLSMAQIHASKLLPNNSACYDPRYYRLAWSARDLKDLQFESTTSTSYVYASLKSYTNQADLGSPTSTTLWTVRVKFTCEFRGVAQ